MKLNNHFDWLSKISGVKMNQQVLNLVQSGSIYIHGRDKEFRPCFIFDSPKIAHWAKVDPSVVSKESFEAGFVFLWNYLKSTMFLPGTVNNWCSFANMG